MPRDITKIKHRKLANPSLQVVLYQPEIPANTGNIARLCAAAEVRLHLIHPLGFQVDDRHLKRAGLDYWGEVDIRHHNSFEDFVAHGAGNGKVAAFTRHAVMDYAKAEIGHGHYLLFGKETMGLPEEIQRAYPCYGIPVWGKVRSLNLSTAVGIVVYHYLHTMGRF
jgi:tRNA (cytidine/uridine-2'-O-)-methyltransferase